MEYERKAIASLGDNFVPGFKSMNIKRLREILKKLWKVEEWSMKDIRLKLWEIGQMKSMIINMEYGRQTTHGSELNLDPGFKFIKFPRLRKILKNVKKLKEGWWIRIDWDFWRWVRWSKRSWIWSMECQWLMVVNAI